MVQCNAGPGEDLRSGTINHQLSINFGGWSQFYAEFGSLYCVTDLINGQNFLAAAKDQFRCSYDTIQLNCG